MTFDRPSVTISFSNPIGGGVYRLQLTQGASGGGSVMWGETIKWRGKVPPTLTSSAYGEDILTFVYINGAWSGDIAADLVFYRRR